MASRFSDSYSIDETEQLGKGAFSVVHRATNKSTGEVYAVKVIDLRPLRLRPGFDSKRLLREVAIMRQCTHENIVGFVDEFIDDDDDRLFMVMELCEGMELFDEIIARGFFSETDARPIFIQLASALAHLHARSIIHRDVKPENCKVYYPDSERGSCPTVKLLDFGLAKIIAGSSKGSTAKTFVGTPCYLAPEIEILASSSGEHGTGLGYGIQVDCWSLGATLYVTLLSRFPEFDREVPERPKVKLTGPVWDGISDAAKDLIKALMEPNPSIRMTAEQALNHPWTQGGVPAAAAADGDSSEAIVAVHSKPLGNQSNMGNQFSSLRVLSFNDGWTHPVYPLSVPSELPLNRSNGGAQDVPRALVPLRRDQREVVEGEGRQSSLGKSFIGYTKKVCGLVCSPLSPRRTILRPLAVQGRALLLETAQILQKIEAGGALIAESLQDVALAVKEDEPILAHKSMDAHMSLVSNLRDDIRRRKMLNDNMIASVIRLQSELDTASSKEPLPPSVLNVSRGENGYLGNKNAGGGGEAAQDDVKTCDSDKNLPLGVESVSSARDDLIPLIVSDGKKNPRVNHREPGVQPPSDKKSSENLAPFLQEIEKDLVNTQVVWGHLHVIFDEIYSRAEVLKNFIDFHKNPRLRERLEARMSDYTQKWAQIRRFAREGIEHEAAHKQDSFV